MTQPGRSLSSALPPLSRRRFIGGISALATGIGIGGTLSACSSDEAKSGPATGKVAIWTNHPEPTAKEIQGYINTFKQANPGVEITLLNIADPDQYYTKLKTSAVGKQLPDIFMSRTFDLASNVANGWLQPLDEQITKQPGLLNLETLGKAATAQNTIDGKVYAAPIDFSCWAVYYNKTLFESSGIEVPTNDWTWDDFFETAGQFKKEKNGKTVQWGTTIGFYHWLFLGILAANGGSAFSEDLKSCTLDTPENMAVFDRFASLFKDKIAPTAEEIPAGVNPFSTGKIAFDVNGSWVREPYNDAIGKKFEWDVLKLPNGSTGKRDVATAGASWTISSASKNPEAAFKLISAMSSGAIKTWDDKNAKFDADGVPPAHYADVDDQFVTDAYELTYPRFWTEFDTAWTNRAPSMATKSPSEIIPALQDDVNAAAARYNR